MFRLSSVYVCCLIILGLISVSCGVSKPIPTPTLPSSETDFPLALNNTWMFQATRYEGVPITEILTTTLVITETVVEVKSTSSYFIAKIHRDESAETPVGDVPPSWRGVPLRPSTSSEYWLIANGNRIYRQRSLDTSSLHSTGELELVFPLKVGEKWYQSDEMAKLYPNYDNDSMLRKVVRVDTVAVPAGRFENCYFLTEVIGGSTFEDWFCPRIGFVDLKSDHHGTPFGWRQVLIRYHLEK